MSRPKVRRSADGPAAFHTPAVTDREALLFEAGVKLGGVFHQYLGIPVSPATAPGLARTIEAAVRLQPYVRFVEVSIDPARGGPVGKGRFAYRYLTAEMLTVRVHLADGPTEVTAELAHRPALRYPLMRVAAIRSTAPRGRRPTRARRSAPT